MKSLLFPLFLIGISLIASAQPTQISQDWTAFHQSVDASFVKEKTKFRVEASVKVISGDSVAWAGVWARVDNKDGEGGFFDNMWDRKIQSGEWQTYTVEGEVDEQSDKVYFGGMVSSNGDFYFDDIKFLVQNSQGKFEAIALENAGFEADVVDGRVPRWRQGIQADQPFAVKEYHLSSSSDYTEGRHSLLIKGEGITEDTTNRIGPAAGFSPQIGTLITMLNNLSNQVEYHVQLLDQERTDFLLDEKANSIGALIMHLAAAEAYYQVYTFEGRGFNEEEEKKMAGSTGAGRRSSPEVQRPRYSVLSTYLPGSQTKNDRGVKEAR